MGRKTFESIGRPLPGRANVVLGRAMAGAENQTSAEGDPLLFRAGSIEQALLAADLFAISRESAEIFVIGGARLFNEPAISDWLNRVYLTEVYAPVSGDAYFDMRFPKTEWRIESEQDFMASDADEYGSRFTIYDRRERRRRVDDLSAKLAEEAAKNAWLAEQIERNLPAIRRYEAMRQAHIEP